MTKLRSVLDVQVSSRKQHTSGHTKAALRRLLDELAHSMQAPSAEAQAGARRTGTP